MLQSTPQWNKVELRLLLIYLFGWENLFSQTKTREIEGIIKSRSGDTDIISEISGICER